MCYENSIIDLKNKLNHMSTKENNKPLSPSENNCHSNSSSSSSSSSSFSIDAQGRDQWTSLHLASYFNRAEFATLLMSSGASTSLTTKKNKLTPLHLACSNGNLDIVKILMNYNQEVCYEKKIRCTA
jgi:ankyrin repeat protein